MKRTSFVLTLLLFLALVSCTATPAPTTTPSIPATETTTLALTPTGIVTVIETATSPVIIPSPPTDISTLTPTTILPTGTPSSLNSMPTGRIIFFWDPTQIERPDEPGPEPKENLYIVTLANGAVETVLDEWIDLSFEAPSSPSVALSPNQTMLAFTVQKDSDGDSFWDRNSIYVYNLITQDLQVVVNEHHLGIGELSWTPDSQTVTYGVDKTVWTITLTDLIPTPLVGELSEHIGHVKWSPNGELLAIHLNATLGRIAFYEPESSLINEVTTNQLTSPFNMSWSPDGRWFVSNQIAASGIFVVKINEYEIVFLTNTGFNRPDWSLDSSHLAFVERIEDRSNLLLWSSNTLTTTTVLGGEHIGNPIWSPNGEELAVTCTCDGQQNLFIVDKTDLHVTQLIDGEFLQVIELHTWSPDGDWLLLTGTQNNSRGLYIVNKSAGQTYLLLETPFNTREPEQFFWLAD